MADRPLLRALALTTLAVALFLSLACRTLPPRAEGAVPQTGTELVQRMHDRYASSWYHSMTFVQRTTRYRTDAAPQVSTWYESQEGDRLRIDIGDPSAGNGVLYTSDSLYVVRDGRVARTVPEGNIFLPLIAGVYTQPLDRTLAQLALFSFDLTRLRADEWEGRRVYVVGARDARDLASPQFWVDAERLVVTRVLAPLIPNGRAPAQDIRLEGYEKVPGGWLATRVRMLDGEQPLQTEEYSDWHVNVAFPPGFLTVEHWSDGPHWARTAGSARRGSDGTRPSSR